MTEKRGPGRPKLAEQVRRLGLKVPAELLAASQAAAQAQGVPLSEWWRRVAEQALQSQHDQG